MKSILPRLLLIIIPLLMLEFIGEAFLRARFRMERTQFEGILADRVESIAVDTDADLYVERPLRAIFQHFFRSPCKPVIASAAQLIALLAPDLEFELISFDGSGTNPVAWPSKMPNQWLLKKLGRALMTDEEAVRAPLQRDLERLLPPVFGQTRTFTSFRAAQGKIRRLRYQGREIRFFWDCHSDRGLILLCRSETDFRDRFSRVLQRAHVTLPYSGIAGIRSPAGETWETTASRFSSTSERRVNEIWRIIERQGRDNFVYKGRWWEFRQTNGGMILFLTAKIPSSLKHADLKPWRVLFLVFLLPFGLWLAVRGDRLGTIRQLVPFLFLLTALVPAGGMALGAILALDGREAVLRVSVHRAEIEALRRLDDGFVGHIQRFQRRVASVLLSPTFGSSASEALRLSEILLKKPFQGRIELRAPNGHNVYPLDGEVTGIRAILGPFQRMAMENWAPKRIPPDYARSDKVIETFLREPTAGFITMAWRPRQFNSLVTGISQLYFIWNIFPQAAFPIAFCDMLFQRDALLEDFLRHAVLERSELWNTQIRLGARHTETGASFQQGGVPWKSLQSALDKAHVLKMQVQGVFSFKGERSRYTVAAGTEAGGYGLIAYFPERVIEEFLTDLKMRVASGMILTLIVAVLVGVLISRRLLIPVSDLAVGIGALRKKKFNDLVPVHGSDELGRLAEAFNAMSQELKDLDVARAVQASLIPTGFPSAPGYDLYGMSRFVGDLGGDCLECRVLPDGQILLLIGDVSGHGAASALLMTFVKAAVSLWTDEIVPDGVGYPDLRELIRRIDFMLRGLGGKRQFLAVFCGLLDSRAHRFSYVSGGHPFPFLRRRNDRSTFLGKPAYPLGIRRKEVVCVCEELSLEPGDLLLFYTDGFIEAQDIEHRMLGYDGFVNALESDVFRKNKDIGARECVEILSRFHEERCPVPDDDLTLMALIRREESAT
ncbi:MAG: SpoIIE family protein phosphatase [Candidatus Ozemobacteraceae bacterium]